MKKKLTVSHNVEWDVCDRFDGKTLAESIKMLQEWEGEHGSTAKFDYDYGYGDDAGSLNLNVTRPETDAEYAERMGREQTAKQKQEATERALLATLQGKYGIVPQVG